jgi:hypothetical protein
LVPIGLDDKKLLNWPAPASSYDNEDIGEEEDSNSLSHDKGIVHELQSDDIHEDNDPIKIPKVTAGQATSCPSDQEPIASVVLRNQVTLAFQSGLTDFAKQVGPVSQTVRPFLV